MNSEQTIQGESFFGDRYFLCELLSKSPLPFNCSFIFFPICPRLIINLFIIKSQLFNDDYKILSKLIWKLYYYDTVEPKHVERIDALNCDAF